VGVRSTFADHKKGKGLRDGNLFSKVGTGGERAIVAFCSKNRKLEETVAGPDFIGGD